MMKQSGWVTVLMTTYNRASFLERSIDSCFNQDYQRIEVVVVDDGSQDETQTVLKHLQAKWGRERIKVLSNEQNLGTAPSLNRALDEIGGEYFQFLDSDDMLRREKISSQIEALRKENAQVAVCGFRCVDSKNLSETRRDGNFEDVKKRLARFRGINNAASLMRTDSLPGKLRFNSAIKNFIDRDFFFRYFLTVRKWIHTPGFLVDYYQHEDSISFRRIGLKIDYELYWKSVEEFISQEAKSVIPENAWMLSDLAYSLSRLSSHSSCRAEAQRLGLSAMRKAVSLRQFIKGGMALFDSLQVRRL